MLDLRTPCRAGAMLAIAGGISLATGLMVTAGGAAQAQASYEVEPRSPQFIYDRTCGYCHGHNVGPIILGRDLPASVVSAFVRTGNGAMPAFKPTEITDEELQALSEWISASEGDPDEHGQ